MSKEIDMTETVTVHLTQFGCAVYRRYMREGHDPDLQTGSLPAALDLPLWEAFKIFGRHVVTSTRLPFDGVIGVGDSAEKKRADAALKQLSALDALFSDIARALRLPLDYATLRRWAGEAPPEIPDQPGWWWLDDRAVRVDDTEDGTLVVVLGNGRRKLIGDVDVGMWGGPALRDPRLVTPDEREDDDIPF